MRMYNVKEVAEWRLCVGCGACAFICPDDKIKLIDVIHDGIRPLVDSSSCGDCDECINVCPGYETIQQYPENASEVLHGLTEVWGPILEIWEGYANDYEIRYNGSSGGLASALALYCLEKEEMYGVLHTGVDNKYAWKNKTVFSKNRSELLSRTGSRYSPASPCEGLDQIVSAKGSCVFIGKPCDVAGLKKAQHMKDKLNEKVGIAIGIFCAGTPSTNGTLELFKSLNVESNNVKEIRYRGRGWPGMTTIQSRGDERTSKDISYQESWGLLQKYRPYRCYLCPDGTAGLADISCGDPWYRKLKEDEIGYSLLIVRTEKGRRIVRGAIDAGYITLSRAEPMILENSQKGMYFKRGAIWGRLFAMKLCFIPVPRYKGFYLFKNWWNLRIREKVRSILGTGRRIIQRKYYKPFRYG